MARSPAGTILTETHRKRQESLTALVLRDLLGLWERIVRPDDFATFEAFAEAAAVLVGVRRAESAELAAQYYAQFREAEGVPGTGPLMLAGAATLGDDEATPVVPQQYPQNELSGLLRGAALQAMVQSRRAGESLDTASQRALVAVQGSAVRVALDGGRDLLRDAIAADAEAIGYVRVPDADPCSFCAMLAANGLIKKEITELDRSRWVRGPTGRRMRPRVTRLPKIQVHDHDQCTLEPFFEGSQLPPGAERYRQLWDEVTERQSGRNARIAFRRALEGRA